MALVSLAALVFRAESYLSMLSMLYSFYNPRAEKRRLATLSAATPDASTTEVETLID